MLRLGWTDMLLRAAVLALGASALMACGTLRGGAESGSAEQPSAESQQRYDALLARLRADDPTALADLEKFSAAHPDLAGPLVSLGLARARAGDEAGARQYLQRATQVCSRCGPAWNELGVLHRQQGRFADAEQAYLRAIELQSAYAPAYYNLAVLYELYIQRPEMALYNYERYLQMGGTVSDSEDVAKWAAELRRRAGTTAKTASAEGTP